ncbi:PLP-dependent aminotransferase family protein [Chromatiaceae bacterium AAb-1]|nr:PLP-dependent aminotransferase family protein [Chromatiaceae bacterium AAb-1]
MRLVTDGLRLSGNGNLQQQLYQLLRQQMLQGLWPSGALLPSSRQLADDLQLSRNTVMQVLQQLIAEGYLEGQPGRGYQIVPLPEHYFQPEQTTTPDLPPLTTQHYALPSQQDTDTANGKLQPGVPDLTAFPYAIWQRLLQRHSSRQQLSGFAEPLGYLPLRQALTLYLRQSRQVMCDEQSILITAGAQQALFIAARLVAKAGQQVLMESPGYPRLKQALQLCELDIRHLDASSEHGLDISQLPSPCQAKALFLTPGHQYPLGGIMPLPQRLALLEWAQQQGCWLVEDDYDSEFQYQHRPLPSLQGLAAGKGVIFAGSFSKTLFPALRLGYLVAPTAIIKQAAAILQALHGDIPLLPQAALADFISEGHFNRHLRKMRKNYQYKKQLAARLLQQYLPECRLSALAAGLHLVLEFPKNTDETALLQHLHAQGFRAQPLSRYLFNGENRSGLVLGIANHSGEQLQQAIIRLATCCSQQQGLC